MDEPYSEGRAPFTSLQRTMGYPGLNLEIQKKKEFWSVGV